MLCCSVSVLIWIFTIGYSQLHHPLIIRAFRIKASASLSSTIKVWEVNLRRLKESQLNIEIEEDLIMKFTKKQWRRGKKAPTRRWNGRQIKNAFQTAVALAKWDFQSNGHGLERPCLSSKQFDVVEETSAHFDDYITTMHGVEEQQDVWDILAAQETIRLNQQGQKPRRPPAKTSLLKRNANTPKAFENEDLDTDEKEDMVKQLKRELKQKEAQKAPQTTPSKSSPFSRGRKMTPQTKEAAIESSSDSSDSTD